MSYNPNIKEVLMLSREVILKQNIQLLNDWIAEKEKRIKKLGYELKDLDNEIERLELQMIYTKAQEEKNDNA